METFVLKNPGKLQQLKMSRIVDLISVAEIMVSSVQIIPIIFKSEDLKTASVNITEISRVTPCDLAYGDESFGGFYCLRLKVIRP
jgi:hypothetical protein